MHKFWLVTIVAWCHFVAGAARAEIDLTIGVNGYFRVGQWTPVEVGGLEADAAAIVATDPTGQSIEWPLAKTEAGFSGSLQLANVSSRCLLVSGDQSTPVAAFVPERIGTPVPGADRLWLCCPKPLGFEEAAATYRSVVSDHSVTVETVASLSKLALDGLMASNVIVVTGQVEEDASAMLRRWVARGGHLVIAGGYESPIADQTGREMPVRGDWVPIRVEGEARFRDLNSLETAVPGGRNLRVKTPVRGVRLASDVGRDVVRSSYGSVIMRAPYGLGRVTALAFDLSVEPLQRWDSLDALCLILADEVPVAARQGSVQNRLTRTGVSEHTTQLLATVDTPEGATRFRPDVWAILGRLVLYAVAVSVIDFLVVHRLLRVPQLTWLTLPCWAIGAGLLFLQPFASDAAFETSLEATEDQAGDGSAKTVRSLTLFDIDADTKYLRQQSWSSVGVAERQRLAVDRASDFPARVLGADADQLDNKLRLGWAAAPEPTFGGLYRDKQVGLSTDPATAAGDRTGLSDISVVPQGTRLYEVTADDFVDFDKVPVAFDLTLRGTRPTGTITNNLPVPVRDWSIAVGRLMVVPVAEELQTLDPGETVTLTLENAQMRSLRDVLTGIERAQVRDGKSDKHVRNVASKQEYDVTSGDVAAILRVASFYETAGGQSYTGLRNSGAPAGLELSHVLPHDRLVFLAKLDSEEQPVTSEGGLRALPSQAFVRLISPLQSP